jgi:hypothetical protein
VNYLLSEAEVPRDVAPMAEITWTGPGKSRVDSGQPIVVLPGNDGEHR